MQDQLKTPQPEDKPNKDLIQKAAQKAVIRTMRSDIQKLLQKEKVTLPAEIVNIKNEKDVNLQVRRKPRFKKILLWGFILLFIIGAGGIGWFFIKPATKNRGVIDIPKTPRPFFATEFSRTYTIQTGDTNKFISSVEDSLQDSEREDSMRRILILMVGEENKRFAELKDLFDAYQIKSPPGFLQNIQSPLMLVVHYTAKSPQIGFAVQISDPSKALTDLSLWETILASDFQKFLPQPAENLNLPFEDFTFRNIDFRYKKLSEDNEFGIAYGLFPAKNLLMFATSKKTIEIMIDRLLQAK